MQTCLNKKGKLKNSFSQRTIHLQIIIFLFLPISILCQPTTITIHGLIEDSASGERLQNANIYDLASKRGATSNGYGLYSLSVPSGTVKLFVSYVGYRSYETEFNATNDTNLNFSLLQESEIKEVIVKGSRILNSPSGFRNLQMKDISSIPLLLGEPDLMKAVQYLPGILPGSEGNTGLYIRGGNADQTLLLLDGVNVYNPAHLYGFFSIFNPEAINDIQLFTGYIPPKFSGRLSGIADVRMREGNFNKTSASVSIGILASNLRLEGPIIKNKSSYLFTARRSYIDLFLEPMQVHLGDYDASGYAFYDLNGKINFKLSEKSRIYISSYNGHDNAESRNTTLISDSLYSINNSIEESLSWGNTIVNLRWNYIISNKWFMNAAVSYGHYSYDSYSKNYQQNSFGSRGNTNIKSTSTTSIGTGSTLKDLSFKLDMTNHISPFVQLNWGMHHSNGYYCPTVRTIKSTINSDSIGQTHQRSISYQIQTENFYLEGKFAIGEKIKLSFGGTASIFTNSAKYFIMQPRTLVEIRPMSVLNIHLAYSETTQFLHTLSFSTIQTGSDIIVPATKIAKPEFCKISSLGIDLKLIPEIILSAEVYYKYLNGLVEYMEGASYLSSDKNWEEIITEGKGRAYGIETSLKKQSGVLTVCLNYSYSRSERLFSKLNNGIIFPAKYDRPNNFNLSLNYHLSKKTNLSMIWIYMSGYVVSMPVGYYASALSHPIDKLQYQFTQFPDIEDYGHNNHRMPDYHRLDIAVQYIFGKTKLHQELNFGIYNLYNRQNPYQIYYNRKNGNSYFVPEISGTELFPILPYITYKIGF